VFNLKACVRSFCTELSREDRLQETDRKNTYDTSPGHFRLDLTMKTAVALLALAASASAFTGTQPSARSTAVRAVVDDYDGNMDLRGKEFNFDPVSHGSLPVVSGHVDCID
jgi:hypothetical protein